MVSSSRGGALSGTANTGRRAVFSAYARFSCLDIAWILRVLACTWLVACFFELDQLRPHFGAGERLARLSKGRHGRECKSSSSDEQLNVFHDGYLGTLSFPQTPVCASVNTV